MYHAINDTPIGQAAQIPVVDEQVGLELAGKSAVGVLLFGIVAIHRIKLQPATPAKLYSLVKQPALADSPQDKLMPFPGQQLQRIHGKRYLPTDSRITVFNNSAVEIYCDYHLFKWEFSGAEPRSYKLRATSKVSKYSVGSYS